MDQTDRGSYRKKDSVSKQFTRSCLGRAIIGAVVLVILLIIAFLTCPTEQEMRAEMNDNIRQCIEENDSIDTDWIDDAVNNVAFAFTTSDSMAVDQKDMELFNKYNTLEYFNHTFFSTMWIYNSFHIQGKRCGYGFFGLVLPTVNFSDFLIREGPLRKDYNQPIPTNYGDEEYFGENPDLGGVFQYNGE